ncbi:hypothetical protein Tco_0730191 [Tanacetum coccineum]|uniref:Uncharacterized protein n=1 Tax=Tanacetum coccineum TaxID=301880 RepID=A0ABQ4YRI5_9ASTR
MVSATKDPLTFNDLMATPIDFSKHIIELEYNFQECFNALIDKLDWNNPEGDCYPSDMSKPLPLQGSPGHLTIVADYFFNNHLEYLKSSDLEKKYTTSITKTKAARYEIVGIEDMVPTLWSPIKFGYDKDALKWIKHWVERRKLWYRSQVEKLNGHGKLDEIVVKRADRQLYKLFHLNDSDIVDFIMALRMFTRSLAIKTIPEIEFKELYTPSHKPPGVIYKDLNKQKRVIRADELYKFSDGTLKKVRDELHHRVLDFLLGYNDEMSKRKWTAIDRKRSQLMVKIINKQMRERRVIWNLERLVGAQELEMDYKLMTCTI